jgi:hypothetical protein
MRFSVTVKNTAYSNLSVDIFECNRYCFSPNCRVVTLYIDVNKKEKLLAEIVCSNNTQVIIKNLETINH